MVDEVHRDTDRLFKMIGEAYTVLSDPTKVLSLHVVLLAHVSVIFDGHLQFPSIHTSFVICTEKIHVTCFSSVPIMI